MGRHSRAEEPVPENRRPPHRSGGFTDDTPTDQLVAARHRDDSAGRRVSRGPVLSAAAVVVVALLVVGWFQLRSAVDEEGVQAAATCVDGEQKVDIAADPDVAPALTEIARRYATTNPVIRDHCVDVRIDAVASTVALSGLTATWDEAKLGPRPAAWVAVDSSYTDRLAADAPAGLDGRPTSVAVSPLVLAVPQDAGAAITAKELAWSALPGLQGRGDGWAAFGRPTWGAFALALPTGSGGATMAPQAAQAVAAGLNGGTVPTGEALEVPEVKGALAALGRGPDPQPATTEAALQTLATTPAVPGLPFQAVPATEQQVFAIAAADAGAISAATPAGPTPVADYPFALLAGENVDDTDSRTVAAFEEYVMAPDAQQVLADDGFRTGSGTLPDGGAAVPFGPMPPTLARAGVPAADAITAALRKA